MSHIHDNRTSLCQLTGVRNSAPVQTGPGAHRFSCTKGYHFCFRRVKQPGSGIDYAHLHTADVKERLQLYFCSPTRSLWHVYLHGNLQFTRNGVTSLDLQNQILDPPNLGGGAGIHHPNIRREKKICSPSRPIAAANIWLATNFTARVFENNFLKNLAKIGR